jgi:hypothetical protein
LDLAEIPWQSPCCFQEIFDYVPEYEIATEYAKLFSIQINLQAGISLP